jgi:hypothetical protein
VQFVKNSPLIINATKIPKEQEKNNINIYSFFIHNYIVYIFDEIYL